MAAGLNNTGRATFLAHIDRLLQARQLLDAERACNDALAGGPSDADVLLRLAHARQQMGNFSGMLEAAAHAASASTARLDARLVKASALAHCGQIAEARAALADVQRVAQSDPAGLRHVAEAWVHLNGFANAEQCLRRLLELAPGEPSALFALSSVRVALGDMTEAETLLDAVIAKARFDHDAFYNRSTLRRQTLASNHVVQLQAQLHLQKANGAGEVPLCYALSKELEDLGEHARAAEFLFRGAATRRRQMSYRVETDVEAMAALELAFPAETLAGVQVEHGRAGPIFIVGLPRSGTTLVDRIISAHSAVASLGELTDLALAVTRLNFPAGNKLALIGKSAGMDFAALGAAYRQAIGGYGAGKAWLIDKTPANFLYLGLIAKAMPEARIIHLRRHPMAAGHAMFKTLFRMGYPFSYDLEDLGKYIAAYLRLMDHWRRAMPGRFLDVDYEELVHHQEPVSRRMLEHCGLPWENACLHFHENSSPSATASAAQVRQPMHQGSVELWRRYERELEPLARTLSGLGVPL